VENEQFVKRSLAAIGNIVYVPLGVNKLDDSSYNTILKSEWFWMTLAEKGIQKALVFQVDALVISADVNKFLVWDYIGAPWTVDNDCYKKDARNEAGVPIPPLPPHIRVGNVGLSLRSTLAMVHVLTLFGNTTTPDEQEDVFFVRNLGKLDYVVADLISGAEFSLEVPTEAFSASTELFAVHQSWLYMNSPENQRILKSKLDLMLSRPYPSPLDEKC
jgi:hypothetical protein